VEETTLLQQLLVGTLFNDLPLAYHNDIISIADGTEAEGDDKTRPALHLSQQRSRR
jgi:hypothetical protein